MRYLTEERFIVHSNDKEAVKNYRENWERIFGEKEPHAAAASDAIECRIRSWVWWCEVCQAPIFDPENHQYHAIIKLTDESNSEDK